jgi:tricarballylate dehydrogenase
MGDAPRRVDVVVVGAGNAGLCAAIAAREAGARVLLLERGAPATRGGNSWYTAGAMRVAYRDVDDLLSVYDPLSDDEIGRTDFGAYPEQAFYDDLARVTEYRCDAELASTLVSRSLGTLQWMRGNGVRFLPSYGRQSFDVDGRRKFWGGLAVEVAGGGPGLVDALFSRATDLGVDIVYQARAIGLHDDRGSIDGLTYRRDGSTVAVQTRSVVLAAGGFEANGEWRTRYLGPGWDLAKVRGTRFNTGDGIRMALELGAMPWGQWSGCHAVAWDRNAPDFGDPSVGDGFQKHSYPLGIIVNAEGRRFVDEGADFRNYTYAKYGRAILGQPGQVAWQVFDAKVTDLLRDEYRIKQCTRVRADTLDELAAKMEGIDARQFLAEIETFNRAVQDGRPFNPAVRDGRATAGLPIAKSNWANPLDVPPYEAYQVTCGITFTFGGLKVDAGARVIDTEDVAIPGLFAAGELVGGLFYFNYPGGSGLTSGSVFGRIAGSGAAAHAMPA